MTEIKIERCGECPMWHEGYCMWIGEPIPGRNVSAMCVEERRDACIRRCHEWVLKQETTK